MFIINKTYRLNY